jgi:hypothetical protein
MGIESADDLSDFFLTDDFGVAATYTAAGESAATINVLFDKPFNSIPMDSGEVDIESNTPTALCQTTDVSAAAHGDVIVISSNTYHVVGVQADSGSGYQGTTLLVLEEQ